MVYRKCKFRIEPACFRHATIYLFPLVCFLHGTLFQLTSFFSTCTIALKSFFALFACVFILCFGCTCLLFILLQNQIYNVNFIADDEGGTVKPVVTKKSSENDMYMRLGLLLGDGARRSKRIPDRSHESCSSLTSYETTAVMSTNTSPVSTLTGSSEDQHRINPSSDSVGSLMSMSMSGQSNCSSSPVSRRHSVTSK